MATYNIVDDIECPYCNSKVKGTEDLLNLYDLQDGHTSMTECIGCGYFFFVSVEIEVFYHYSIEKIDPQPTEEENEDFTGQEFFKFYKKD
ncbi:hypothetical protein LCGC14_1337040 [marine sediment metagenome]|uniref:Uncharacterized protein n=1 Tax=marine sediment metagenome TaxID=412755 RepID=A0A0F9KFJ0_9ZZZZ